MILSVKLDDKNELGVDFELLRDKDTIRIVSGSPINTLVTAEFKEGGVGVATDADGVIYFTQVYLEPQRLRPQE